MKGAHGITERKPVASVEILNAPDSASAETAKCFYCAGELKGKVKYRWDDNASCLKCFEDRVEEVMERMYERTHPVPIAHRWGSPL